jgi:predicted dienelactone hydrolase
MIRICAVAVFALGFACPALAADPSARDFAARTEIFDIHTLTLSDKQFLTGDAEAKATVTSGKLRVAQGEGKLPVVVLVHGSGGMGNNIELWERTFNAMGVSTFALDGFTGRGLTQTSTN